MQEHEPKFKLRKYEDEILFLLYEGYSQNEILLYLKEYYQVDVTRQTLSSHLKFLKTKDTKKPKEEEEKSKDGSSSKSERMTPQEMKEKLLREK